MKTTPETPFPNISVKKKLFSYYFWRTVCDDDDAMLICRQQQQKLLTFFLSDNLQPPPPSLCGIFLLSILPELHSFPFQIDLGDNCKVRSRQRRQ